MGQPRAIAFYGEVFGARARSRFPGPGGTISHADLEVGDSLIMLEDASELRGSQAPLRDGSPGSRAYHFVCIDDVDAAIDRAVQLGAAHSTVRPKTISGR